MTAVLPIILELWRLINGSEFMWRFVTRWWIGMIPLLAIFLIHNSLLIPKFMKKGKMKGYCLILFGIVTAYGALQYAGERRMLNEFTELREKSIP